MKTKNNITDIEGDEVIVERNINNSVPTDEQELHISAMRNEKHAFIYASDSTYMTKLDKLCKTSPNMYSLVNDDSRGKTYRLEDKTLISFRAKKKELSDEAKAAASERFSKLHAEGKIGKKKKGE